VLAAKTRSAAYGRTETVSEAASIDPRLAVPKRKRHNGSMPAPPLLFDQALRDSRRRRAIGKPAADADFLARAVAEDLAERLGAVERQFTFGLDISPLPIAAASIAATGQVHRVVRLDRIAETRPDLIGDPEFLPFAPATFDLVVSVLAFQWVNDLPGALLQFRRALKPDGLLLASFLGGETLTELRQSLAAAEEELTGGASPRVAPFVDLRTAGSLLQRAGFALPVIDIDRRTVRYASVLTLIRDLRATGATNALHERSRTPMTRSLLARTAEIYAQRFADPDGRLRATFEIVSLSGWAPHRSQQQPLRPGSAKARLADALGTVEQPAGDKARR
jgi:SAM-dependent methyltransferase